ncbi:MAG TPA: hypothetical protein VFD30_22990 [Terriglobia bacterium]|nr:hypothetical protein [Terriglobia bacterium]
MPTSNAAELLIRIGADPANAEASIQSFRQSFSSSLTGLGADLNKWSVKGLGDFNLVRSAVSGLGTSLAQAAQTTSPLNSGLSTIDKTATTLASHFNVNLNTVSNILTRNRVIARAWKTELVAAFVDVLQVGQAFESSLGRSFLIFDSALGANIANAVIWQKSIGEAFRKAALQAISAIAQEALVRAVYSTALGFYLLAIQDYSGAALAFKSAAAYGAAGGAAALAGRALVAPDVHEAQRGAVVRQPGAVAPDYIVSGKGDAAAQAAVQPQKTVQVVFQGPVYGGQAGIDELVRHISSAVTERDVNLVAYTVVRQPATRA